MSAASSEAGVADRVQPRHGRPLATTSPRARRTHDAKVAAPDRPGPADLASATLGETLPEDVIPTNGAGDPAVWPKEFLPFGPRSPLLAPPPGAGNGEPPAAIAAKIARPGRTVVSFAGDGDAQTVCQEFAAAMRTGARPIALAANGLDGTIRVRQEHAPSRTRLRHDAAIPAVAGLAPRPLRERPEA